MQASIRKTISLPKPSGLQAAASLALKGHEVTIYESQEKAGGWLRYGIPEYRLPNEIVDKEIHRIEELGVKIVTNTNVDDNQLAKLLKEYDAVLLSTGSLRPSPHGWLRE